MNRDRRKRLKQAIDRITEASGIVEEVMDEEQDSFDNLPEGLADGPTGERLEENVDTLGDVLSSLGEAIDGIEEVVG